MQVLLSPQRRDDSLVVVKDGGKLRINGDLFSFISLPDGATIPAGEIPCEWIVGPVERIDGEINLTLVLPHGPNPSPAVAYPTPLVDPPDGALALPFDQTATEPEVLDDVDA
jgi:hypothetical protein